MMKLNLKLKLLELACRPGPVAVGVAVRTVAKDAVV